MGEYDYQTTLQYEIFKKSLLFSELSFGNEVFIAQHCNNNGALNLHQAKIEHLQIKVQFGDLSIATQKRTANKNIQITKSSFSFSLVYFCI